MDSYLIGQLPLSDGGSPITDYILYRGTTSGTETFYREGYFAPTYLFYNDTSVIVGDQYFYTIAAINNVGTGPQSCGSQRHRGKCPKRSIKFPCYTSYQ